MMISEVLDEKEVEKQGQVHTYKRPKELMISADKGEIRVSGFTEKLYLSDNTLYISEANSIHLYKNAKRVLENEVEIVAGDIFDIEGISLTIFDDYIEVVENTEKPLSIHGLLEIPNPQDKYEGFPSFRRSPRIIFEDKKREIEINKPVGQEKPNKRGIVQLIIPPLMTLMLTVVMAIVTKRGGYVFMTAGMTLLTTIFSVREYFTDKKDKAKKNTIRIEKYSAYLIRMRNRIRKGRREEAEIVAYSYPEPKTLEKMIETYNSRIYEKTPTDDDFLAVSLGYQVGKSNIKIKFEENDLESSEDILLDEARELVEEFSTQSINKKYLQNKDSASDDIIVKFPVTVNLKRAHLGLVGSKKLIHEQIKSILEQLTFFHSYHDLEVVVIHDASVNAAFSYMRWYPHLRLKAVNVIGEINNEGIRDQILSSLQQILKERKQRIDESKKTENFMPHFLFIIDEPKIINNHAIMEFLENKSMALGFSMIYATNQVATLPENVKTVCQLLNKDEGELLLNEGKAVNETFIPLSTEGVDLESMARTLASLIHEKGVTSKIPESITFFDMYKIKHPYEMNSKERWEKNESYKTLAVPLGLREQDSYVELNLHEKAHGPHGLVAGTTGSGKSEIVQSYILSLAANFHPYEVGFLLIDYKGGGMANLFANLPHLLGTITNLDGQASMRAMTSIKAELSRRQKIFSDNGVNHINGYHKMFKLGKVSEPIPHLFLISDEFAELKKEQPEFMTELVSAARIGRSLGIHLILATQKPSGVVDDQIWTNSKFQLCLKVADEADSREMIRTPDAASIVEAGRAYLKVGNNEIYELFQSAWSGAEYSEERATKKIRDKRVYRLNALGQGELINRDLSGGESEMKLTKTQLDVLVDYFKEMFEELDLPEVMRPWLPALEEQIKSPHLPELAVKVTSSHSCEYRNPKEGILGQAQYDKDEPNIIETKDINTIVDSATFTSHNLKVEIGIMDIPSEQTQREYIIDFLRDGHVGYFSAGGYGKSVFLTTILLSLVTRNSNKNLAAYILDFGSSALISMRGLPHVADYMSADDTEKIEKFQVLISEEIKTRKKLLAKEMVQSFEIYNQVAKKPLQALFIMVDNYDVVREFDSEFETLFMQIARDGAALGIYFVFTASRLGILKTAIENNIKTKISGFHFDVSEVRAVVGRSDFELPEIKGRTLVKEEIVNIMQVYSPVSFSDSLDYNDKLRKLIEAIRVASTEKKLRGIPVLPENLTEDILEDYEANETLDIVFGLEKEEVKQRGIKRDRGQLLITGGARSGKSNALKLVLNQMINPENNWEKVYLIDTKASEVKGYKDAKNVMYIGKPEDIEALKMEIEALKAKRTRRAEEISEEEEISIEEAMQRLEKRALVISDADYLGELVEGDEASEEFGEMLSHLTDIGIFVVYVADGMTSNLESRGAYMKLMKKIEYALILGEADLFIQFSGMKMRDFPKVVEDGVMYDRGQIESIRVAKVLEG